MLRLGSCRGLAAFANGSGKIHHIIAVSSCKGGVGKSTSAVNLAFSLAALPGAPKVGILDSDIHGPSLPTMITCDDEEPHLIKEDRVIRPFYSHGVAAMSFGYIQRLSSMTPRATVVRGDALTEILQQMVVATEWGPLDYLVIDMPPGTGDAQLTLLKSLCISAAVVVTTPQKLAIVDVEKGIDMFNKMGVPTLAIVENMAYFDGDDGKRYHPFGPGFLQHLVAQQLSEDRKRHGASASQPAAFQMPIDPALCAACDAGEPYVVSHPEGAATGVYRELALCVEAGVAPLVPSSERKADFKSMGWVPTQMHWPTMLDCLNVAAYK